MKKCLPVLLVALLSAGCTTTVITNLTPQVEPRNEKGLYSIEAALSSRQQTIRWDSIQPNVMVGDQLYPMRPTMLMTNRWETLIPIPPGVNVIGYRFKFEYGYNAFGPARKDNKLSPQYRLQIQ